jgi:hypothetical protein
MSTTEQEEVGRIGLTADRAGALRAEPPTASQAKPLIPCAGAFTPGPWQIDPCPDDPCLVWISTGERDGPEWAGLASVVVQLECEESGALSGDSEGRANALLIRSAPDLYEALSREEKRLTEEYFDLCADIQEGDDHKRHMPRIKEIEEALAALRKARGES